MTKTELDKKLKKVDGGNTLTPKERLFLGSYLNLMEQGDGAVASRTEAMLQIRGDLDRGQAAALASAYFRKLKSKMGDILNLVGLDEMSLAYRIMRGVEATVSFQKKDGSLATFDDYKTRLLYLRLALELKGLIGAGVNLNFNQTNVQNNIIVLPESGESEYDPALAIKEFAKLQLPANGTNGNGKHE